MGNVESGVRTLYYGLGIIFMFGGAVVAYVKALQSRIGKQEQALTDYKLEAAQHYVSKWCCQRLQGDQARYDDADQHRVCNPYNRCRNDDLEHFRLPNT